MAKMDVKVELKKETSDEEEEENGWESNDENESKDSPSSSKKSSPKSVSANEPKSIYQKTILLAARDGYTKVVESLIDIGVNVNTKDQSDSTPLHEVFKLCINIHF